MGSTAKKTRVLIHSPYWHILGGGEKYLLQIAHALKNEYEVAVTAPEGYLEKAGRTFGFNLTGIACCPFTRNYGLLFYMTDGSLFLPFNGKNFLIIQSLAHMPSPGLITGLKLIPWRLVCYSSFMKKVIAGALGKDAFTLSPAVDAEKFRVLASGKEKMFLTVGRFFSSHLHEKNQQYLVDFFIKHYKKHFPGWRLAVCGALTEDSGRRVLKELQSQASGHPVEIYANLSFDRLRELYGQAAVYWHAAGYGFDEGQNPEKMEHFGITTVEAMASGSVPVVFAGGGQRDIVENGKSGFLWKSEEEFLDFNLRLINNPPLCRKMRKEAVNRSLVYSPAGFRKRLNELV